MEYKKVSTLQSYDLNPITRGSVVKAMRDVILTENVTPEKIAAGALIHAKLTDGSKTWNTDMVSVNTSQESVTVQLDSLKPQQNWSTDFYDMVQLFSTLTAADAECRGRLVTDGVSFIEVHAVASAGDNGQRHMQIIKARQDIEMAPQIETVQLQHQKPVYRTEHHRRNRFLGLVWDEWQEVVLDHYETVTETQNVTKTPNLTGTDFENLKAFALNQFCRAIL